jgi:hypothetical protein
MSIEAQQQKEINFIVNSTAAAMVIAAIGYAVMITTGIDGWEHIPALFQFVMSSPAWILILGAFMMVVDNERNQQV